MNGSLSDYYGMQATTMQNPYLPSGPMSLADWTEAMEQQGLTRGSQGVDMGDGLGGPTATNNFRLPDGNWLKPTVQNGMVTGTRAENIGLGETMRDGIESMAPFLAVAGTAGTLSHLGVGSGLGQGAATAGASGGGLLSPMTMPPGYAGAATTAAAPVGTGTVLANTAGGGGLLSGIGSAIGNSGLNWGGVIGGIGSAIDAYNTPDTLTTTSTNSLSPEAQGRMNDLLSMTRGQIGQQGAQNPFAAQDNPYLTGMIDRGMNDLSRAYQANRTSAETSAARGNAFGSGRFNLTAQQNMDSFGRSAGDMVNAMRFGDYNQRAQLAESGLNRQFQQDQNAMNRYQSAVNNNAQFNRTASQTGNNPNAGNPFSAGLGGALVGNNIWNSWGN